MNVLDALAVQVVACADFPGNRPYGVAKPWGATALYFNPDDPLFRVDGAAILNEAAKPETGGYFPCIYFVVPRGGDGRAFAEKCSAKVTALGGSPHVAAVLFDNEKVPLDFQRAYMDRWDELRPWRPTIYSVEPFQDATQNDYFRMLRRNNATGTRCRKVTHQDYFGGMQPQKPNDVADYLRVRGVPDDDLCPTIDPAQPASYIASAAACGQRGLVLFEAGRIPR